MVEEIYKYSFEGIYLEEFSSKLLKKLSEFFDTVILNSYLSYSQRYRFSNNLIDVSKLVFTDHIDIFVEKGGKYLSLKVSNVMTKNLEDVVSDVLNQYSVKYEVEERYSHPDVVGEIYDIVPQTFNEDVFNEDRHVDMLDMILNYEGRNVKRLSGVFSAEAEKHIIMTSYNVKGEYKSSRFLFRVRGFKDKDISLTDVDVSVDIDPSRYVNILNQIDEGLGYVDYISTVDEGRYNVVFSPQAFGNLLFYMGYLLSGYFYVRNMSPFSGMLNSDVSSPDICVYDDPRMEGAPDIATFDEEGIATRKTIYIEDGILKDLALNTLIARKLERESNGHAGIITPFPYPLIYESKNSVKGGFNEMISDVGKGIYISNVWYTRFANFREGSLSTLQRDVGLYIDDGEVKGAFTGARISLNIKDLVSKVISVSSESKWVLPWDVWSPAKTGYVALEDIEITTGF